MTKDAEVYVTAAAKAIDLPIPPEYLPGAVLNFERSAALAKQLMDFPLPPGTEPAPVYKP
jgi:hypothetical protein